MALRAMLLHSRVHESLHAGKVEDLGTGEYRTRFSAIEAGAYAVSVQHKGQNIGRSPLAAAVAHGAIAPDCCYVVQEGMERAVAGRQVSTHCLMHPLT